MFNRGWVALVVTAMWLAPACGGTDDGPATTDDGGGTDAGAGADVTGTDATGSDDAGEWDASSPTDGAGSSADADIVAEPDEPLPPLEAGAAEVSLNLPVGVATVGYGPKQGPKTPYAETYPGTNAQHTDLTAKALVLRRGPKALVIVRTDTIGMWQDITRDAQARLRELGHDELAAGLIVSATHTHSSGGRIFDHFIGSIAIGNFLPGLYPRMRDAVVNAAIAADAAREPAQVGHTTIQTDAFHKDRRCENGPIQDDSMGLIKVARTDGSMLALVVNYASHGTVVGTGDFVLSDDGPGAIEHGLESRLPDGPHVLYLQSWAGDMAPVTPQGYVDTEGSDLRHVYLELDAIAAAAADIVGPAIDGIEMTDEPELDIETVYFPLDGDVINPGGDFTDFRFGGFYCFPSTENCGEEQKIYGPEDLGCFPVPEDLTVHWSMMTAARIGDLGLVTLPGEPLTSVGTDLRDKALAATGLGSVFVLGYSQSYLSYLLHPDDFYLAGYEGASALMGPGFGAYLISIGETLAARMMDPSVEFPFEPVELEESSVGVVHEPLTWEGALGEPVLLGQPELVEGAWTTSWNGGDPAADQPLVALEEEVDGTWVPVTHSSGRVVDSRGPAIELELVPDPPYLGAIKLDERTFVWVARMPNLFSVTPSWSQPTGRTLRFVVSGTRPDPYAITSESFEPTAN